MASRLLVGMAVACLLLLLPACTDSPELTLGVSPTEPAPAIAARLESIAKRSGLQLTLVSYPTESELTTALAQGDLDLAVLEQPPGPVPGMGIIASLYPSVLHVLTRVEEACTGVSVYDALLGQAVFAGNVGSAGARLLNELSEIGIAPPTEDMRVLTSAFGETPDTFLIFGGLLSRDARSRLQGYCLLPLGQAGRSLAGGAAFRFPHLERFTLPDGVYPELASSDVTTLAVRTLLLGHSSLPEAVAFDLAQVISDSSAELGEVYPLARAGVFAPLDPARLSLPVLPGAKRYQDKDSPGILERYAEVLALAVTIGIALSSALVAWLRVRRQARKDRLDVYFKRLLELRSELAVSTQAEEVAAQVRSLQATVTQLLVDERIEPDASLVAFISLSGEVLREAEDSRRAP